nr:HD family phosphohydrolase [Vulgatibacter incomptus]
MVAQRDLDALLRMIVREAGRVVDADRCSLFLVDREEKVLYSKVAQGMGPSPRIRVPLGVGIAGATARTRRPINLPDAYADSRFNRAVDLSTGYRTTSLLCVPMFNTDGDVAGVIQALNKAGGVPFSDEDEELLLALGGQAASAVENALLHEEIHQLFEGFVKASVVAIESRDSTTAGHSERVARLTLALADAVERDGRGPFAGIVFSPDQRMELRYAALLHDFGKVGVREHVLMKANKFHPHELTLVEHRFDYARKSFEAESLRRQRDRLAAGERLDPVLMDEEAILSAKLRELEAARELVRRCNRPTVLPAGISAPLAQLAALSFLGPDGLPQTLLSAQEVELLSIPKGSLSPAERLEIESHVSHTYRFLKQIPWTRSLRRIPEIACGHHEKLDGTGYPLGKAGQEIGLEARMMAIADIYDALTVSDRPYKRSVSHDDALEILSADVRSGKLDAEVFRVFVEADVPRRFLEDGEERTAERAAAR